MGKRLLCDVSLVALCIFGCSGAHAQTTDPSTEPAGSEVPAPTPSPTAVAADPSATAADDDAVKDIIVTGSRLQANGFTTPTPVTVIDQDQLKSRGATDVQDVLMEIPAFRGVTGARQTTGASYAVGQGLLDLRGLGPKRTLVLVDGERHVASNADGTFDTNVIPSALIDRIDVVTGGASAAYGSDAIAGVVNIVLNEKLQGIRGTMQFGTSQRWDAKEGLFNVAAGTGFAGGRGHIVFGLDYSHDDPAGTEYSRGWGRKETALISLPASRPAGTPALYLSDQQHLVAPPGSLVVSCVRGGVALAGAACPIGNLTFNGSGQPVAYNFGSPRGAFQMAGGDNDGYNQFRNQYLKVGGQRITGLAHLTYELSSNVIGFAEFSMGRSQVSSRSSDYINSGTIIIQRDNPFLPAALASQMDANGITRFNLARLNYAQQDGVQIKNEDTFWQGSAGLRGRVFNDWKWDVSYTHGNNRFWYKPQGITILPNYLAALYVVRDNIGNPVCGPIASNPMFAALSPAQRTVFAGLVSSGCVPFNPFGPTSESQAAINYVAPQNTQNLTKYFMDTASFNLAGSPFKTWAGDVSLALGGEWRRERVSVVSDPYTAALTSSNAYFAGAPPLPGSGSVSVKEGYAEIGIPLARDIPFLKSFDVNAAVRLTDYSSSGTVTAWKAGATWDIADGLRIRGTRSRDIRAPNISELYLRGNDFSISAVNPLTGATNNINSAAAANPNLKPEIAETWTVGVVLSPKWIDGLKISVDYYSIKLKDVIARISPTNVISRYYSGQRPDYAQYFTFDASVPVGFSRLDIPYQNLNRQESRGLDINVDYRVPINRIGLPGSLRLTAVGSYLQKFETFDDVGVSLGDLAGALPKWGWNGNLNYQIGKFSTTLNVRYNSSVKYNILLTGPDLPNYNPASPTSISKNLFPAAVYFGLQAQYEIRNGIVVYGIVDNLFDKDPPAGSFAMLSGLGGTPSSQYNPYDNIGRYFKAGVRFAF